MASRLLIKRKPLGFRPLPMPPLARMVHKAGFRHDAQQLHEVEWMGAGFRGRQAEPGCIFAGFEAKHGCSPEETVAYSYCFYSDPTDSPTSCLC